MRPEELFRAIGAVDDELLERSRKRRAPSVKWIEWGALAACVCIVAAVSVITVKMSSREYVKPETEEAAQSGQTTPPESETGSRTIDSPAMAVTYEGDTADPDSLESAEGFGTFETYTAPVITHIAEPETESPPTLPASFPTEPSGEESQPVIDEPLPEILPPEETPSPAYYDDSFVDFYVEDPKVGMPMTYDEVMNMLLNTSPGQHELDSYYLIETVRLLSPSECAEVEGIYEFYGSRHSETAEAGADVRPAAYMEDDTIYEVILKKDLITGEETNERCYMLIRHMGNMDEQKNGDPLFAPGELFCAPVDYKEDGEDFRKTAGDFMLRFDVKMSQDGVYTAYFRGDKWDAAALPFGENVDYTVITSTTQNPAHYTKAVALDELTEFLIKDWTERRLTGIS